MPVTIVSWLAGSATYTRDQFNKVRAMLGQQVVGIAQIAKETGLTRQTVYRIKGDPGGAEGALGCLGHVSTRPGAASRET